MRTGGGEVGEEEGQRGWERARSARESAGRAGEKRGGRPTPDDSDGGRLTLAQITRVASCAWAKEELRLQGQDMAKAILDSNLPQYGFCVDFFFAQGIFNFISFFP